MTCLFTGRRILPCEFIVAPGDYGHFVSKIKFWRCYTKMWFLESFEITKINMEPTFVQTIG